MHTTLQQCGLSIAEAAVYLNVSERTIRRWCQTEAPVSAIYALNWLSGKIQHWERFEFKKECVVTPLGSSVNKAVIGNLEYYSYLQRMIGYRNDWLPALPKNPYDVELIDNRAAELLTDLLETFKHQN